MCHTAACNARYGHMPHKNHHEEAAVATQAHTHMCARVQSIQGDQGATCLFGLQLLQANRDREPLQGQQHNDSAKAPHTQLQSVSQTETNL